MSYTKVIVALGVAAALAAPSAASAAQRRGRAPVAVGRAVPRVGPAPRIVQAPRVIRPSVVTVVPYRPYYYRPQPSLGFAYGYPAYRPYYGYGYGYPYGSYASPYGYGYPSGYGYVPGRVYGGVRIDLPERDAQVFVDGYYVGIVDDFDGAFQHLDLTAEPHHIEVRANGYEPIAFDVKVEPGRTITYRADMLATQP